MYVPLRSRHRFSFEYYLERENQDSLIKNKYFPHLTVRLNGPKWHFREIRSGIWKVGVWPCDLIVCSARQASSEGL